LPEPTLAGTPPHKIDVVAIQRVVEHTAAPSFNCAVGVKSVLAKFIPRIVKVPPEPPPDTGEFGLS
jgi:hypothetical protein